MDLLRRLSTARVLDRSAHALSPAPKLSGEISSPPASLSLSLSSSTSFERRDVRVAASLAETAAPLQFGSRTSNRPALLGGCLDRLALPQAPALARDLVCLGAEQGTRAVFIDTETTGMNGAAVPFVIGLAWYEAAVVRVAQWTLSRLSGEAELLADVFGTLRAIGPAPLVSFNGSSFDVPMLRVRARRFGLCERVLDGDHLDLLHGARRLHRGRGRDCRLTTLERDLLGLHRRGDIDSAEIPSVFWTWLQRPDDPGAQRRLRAVCEHNLVDIVSLPALASRLAGMVREPADLDRARRSARHLTLMGAEAQARQVLARWVEPMLDSGRTREVGWREAALELANLERRAGDRTRAAALWRAAYLADPGCPVAVEAWAKQLEHVEREFEAALEVARGSRLPCERRIARLEIRVARARPQLAAEPEIAVAPAAAAEPAGAVAPAVAAEPEAADQRDAGEDHRAVAERPSPAGAPPFMRAPSRAASELLSVVEDSAGARLRYKLLR